MDISVFLEADRFSQDMETHLSNVTNYSRRNSAEGSSTIMETKNPRTLTEEPELKFEL